MCKKLSAILAFIILVVVALFGSAWTAPATLEQARIEMSQSVREGKVVSVKATVGSANGGPATQSMRVDHPQGTVLQVDANLAVDEGYIKIELLDKGKPSLTLEAKKGQGKKGKGRMSVNENGEVEYRVTAQKAQNVRFSFDFLPEKTTKSSQPSTNEKITMSENLQIEGLPRSVVPNGNGKLITLNNFNLKKGNGEISGSLKYKRKQKDDFILIVYAAMSDKLLLIYFDPGSRQTFSTPSGTNGNVSLTLQGYKLKGKENDGTIEFSFPTYLYGTYDIAGNNAKVFAFCIKKGSEQGDLFPAVSNVMQRDISF